MLPEKVKQEIRSCYQNLSQSIPNFRSRREQNFMVAEITKSLAGEYKQAKKIIVIEAGTGIGKSLAYSLGAIPLALQKNKKVCISTATVALQEQLVNKDLPTLQKNLSSKFDFGIVKGRQRYVCVSKLEMMIGENDGAQQALWQTKPDNHQIEQLAELLEDFQQGKWDGERDSLTTKVDDMLWSHIASDKHSCHRQLPGHRHCPFHKARDVIEKLDVLVVNHSLLMADLELGGGVILPPQDEMYFVIDEAHHLPHVVRNFASANASLRASADWLNKLDKSIVKFQTQVPTSLVASPCQNALDDCADLARELLEVVLIWEQQPQLFNNEEQRYRFKDGKLPDALKLNAEQLVLVSGRCLKHFDKINKLISESLKDGDLSASAAEPLLSENGAILQRLENIHKLWKMMHRQDPPKSAPYARWVEVMSGASRLDFMMSASPIEIGFLLQDMLWDKAEGVVLCSATLRALGHFSHFQSQVGLNNSDGSRYLALNSPFDYQNNGTLMIAKMDNEPASDGFTQELIAKLPSYIEDEGATLVLFASYWQMREVAKALQGKFDSPILIQGELATAQLIKTHKKRIDNAKSSIIFGTSSLSEGLDLPRDYLTNLIVTKLPFAVPTSPVEEAHAEYIKHNGGNPFMKITVPDASRKLIQSCGRLLRTEEDYGRIVMMDKRLLTKRYGQGLLDALPPFSLFIEQ